MIEMKPIYIFQNGTLSRKGNTLAFKKSEDGKTIYFPIENLSEIKVFGEISINKRLLEFLSKNSLPIHFYNHHGFYVGSYYPYEHNTNGLTIVKQVEHYLDEEKRINLAKKFVEGAMKNILKIVGYYERRNELKKTYSEKHFKKIPGGIHLNDEGKKAFIVKVNT
jgi:CRISPR-associated protein Cas1